MKIACCIVAAGKGLRLGKEYANVPKALVPILGRPMLYYALNALDNYGGLTEGSGIERFVVTAPPDSVEDFTEHIKVWGFSAPVQVEAGGETRSASVYKALNALRSDPPDWVLITDCARVCLTDEMIGQLLDIALKTSQAATLAHQAVDTLRIINDNRIKDEVDRSVVACIETPQIFPFERLLDLHDQADHEGILPDDTTLFTRAGETVHIVYHERSNMKITYPEDIGAVEGILFSRGWQDAEEGED